MFPMTSWTPKPLLPVRGKPILVWILEKLKHEGWNDIVVCINETQREQFEYHTSRIESSIAIPKDTGIEIKHTFKVTLSGHPRSEELGTAGELVAAARFIKEDFLLYYGDILTRLDTAALREKFEGMSPRPHGLLGVARKARIDKGVADLWGPEILTPSIPVRVVAIREKPLIDLPNLIGVEVLSRAILEEVKVAEDLHRDTLPRLIDKDWRFHAYLTDQEFLDIGSVDAYRRAQDWK